jgi:hypothetical protein
MLKIKITYFSGKIKKKKEKPVDHFSDIDHYIKKPIYFPEIILFKHLLSLFFVW